MYDRLKKYLRIDIKTRTIDLMMESESIYYDVAEIMKYNFIEMKEVITVVELDSFKATLNTYKEPLQEVRDSL